MESETCFQNGIEKPNQPANQSLRAFFHAPLQLTNMIVFQVMPDVKYMLLDLLHWATQVDASPQAFQSFYAWTVKSEVHRKKERNLTMRSVMYLTLNLRCHMR